MFQFNQKMAGEIGHKLINQLMLFGHMAQTRSTNQTQVTSDVIWKHKQERLGLKRTQRDLQIEYRDVKNIQKQYEDAINKRRQSHQEMLRLSKKDEQVAKTQYQHKVNKLKKEQYSENHFLDQELKTGMRKFNQRILDMSRRYHEKILELEKKQKQVADWKKKYEQCIQKNQGEQDNIKKELQNMRVAIKMESTKTEAFENQIKSFQNDKIKKMDRKIQEIKNQFQENNSHKQKYICNSESEMSKIEADLRKIDDKLKQREKKVRGNLLRSNEFLKTMSSRQRKYIEKVEENKMVMNLQESKKNVQNHSIRREEHLLQRRNVMQSHRAKKSDPKVTQADSDLQIFQDNLKHLQFMVDKEKTREVNLYKKVCEAEHTSQKLRRSVTCLQNYLKRFQEKNQRVIQKELKGMDCNEREIQQKIHNKIAELQKSQVEREYCYKKLQDARLALKEDTHLLIGLHQEQNRKKQISERQQGLSGGL